MPINFHPKPGTVLICDYDTGFKPPEMIKKRRVIVISSYQLNKKGLCTVVPLSTTPPEPMEPHHFHIKSGKYNFLHPEKDCWVKCDMVCRVGFYRLDRVRVHGNFIVPKVSVEDLVEIHQCVLAALDIHK